MKGIKINAIAKMKARKVLKHRLKSLLNKFIKKEYPYIEIEKIQVDFYANKKILNELIKLRDEIKKELENEIITDK